MSDALLESLIDAAEKVSEMVESWRDDDGEVVKRQSPFSGDVDDLDMLAVDLDSAAEDIASVAQEVRARKADSAELSHRVEWQEDINADLESLNDRADGAKARRRIADMFAALKAAADGLGDSVRGRRDFYVYVHKTKDGKIFYVGKGTGKRAWSRARHVLWEKYVYQRLGGRYDVEIVIPDLTEREAEERESALIRQYRDELVNWIDPSALSIETSFDAESGTFSISGAGDSPDPDYHVKLDSYHRLEGEIAKVVDKARPLEKIDPERAIAILRDAVARLDELHKTYPREPGLKDELMGDWSPNGKDFVALDRLTIVLSQQKRFAELVAAVDAFSAKYPRSFAGCSVGRAIMARRDKAAQKSEPQP